MTFDEMVEDVRDQVQEYVEAFFRDEDIQRYLKKAIHHFVSRTGACIWVDRFTLDPTKIGDTALPEITELTFVDDVVDALNGTYFVLYDGNNESHAFYLDNGTATPPAGFINTHGIDFTTNDTALTIGANAVSAIQLAADSNGVRQFSAVAGATADIVIVTNSETGALDTPNANVDVDNGTDALTVVQTQAGVNDSYPLSYRFKNHRGITLVDPDNNKWDMRRLAYQDYYVLDNEKREELGVCHIDTRRSRLYVSPEYASGELFMEYHILPSDSNYQSFVDDLLIEEEYHEAIVDYAVYIAFRKDKERGLASDFLRKYLDEERRAIISIGEKLSKPILDDWSMEDTRKHRITEYNTRQHLYEE